MPPGLLGRTEGLIGLRTDHHLAPDEFGIRAIAVVELALDQPTRDFFAVVMGYESRLTGKVPLGINVQRPAFRRLQIGGQDSGCRPQCDVRRGPAGRLSQSTDPVTGA
jgi:hypothetical protein